MSPDGWKNVNYIDSVSGKQLTPQQIAKRLPCAVRTTNVTLSTLRFAAMIERKRLRSDRDQQPGKGKDEGIGVYSDSPNTVTNAAITNNTVYSNLLLGIHIDANSTGNDIWLNTIYLNASYDEVDETGSFALANDWGTTNPANANNLVNGGQFSQKMALATRRATTYA